MFLTIGAPISGTDLGYLIFKNPARLHSFDLPFGKAHVFYPELSDEYSAASLLLGIDPVGLVRGRSQAAAESTLDQYVNDRPYVSSSFLSVAMSRVYGTAMGGRSKERQELADAALDWTAVIAVAPCRGGEPFIRALFEPLGYTVGAERHPLDERFPEWGDGFHYTIRISGRKRLQDLLTHIYVLVPVLDAEKHYWVGDDEVEKLLRKGEGWLAAHPEREAITSRYLNSHSGGEQDWGGPSRYQFPHFALNWNLRWMLRNLALLPCWPKSLRSRATSRASCAQPVRATDICTATAT